MAQESAFVAMLAKVASAKVTGQQLELRDAAGAVLARFDVLPMPVE